MRFLTAVLTVMIAIAFIGVVAAVPPGQKIEYAGGPMGKVVFDGKSHADKGLKCADCHTKLFQMKREAKIKMADHNADKYCFSCHNGDRAFKSAGNCAKCHTK